MAESSLQLTADAIIREAREKKASDVHISDQWKTDPGADAVISR